MSEPAGERRCEHPKCDGVVVPMGYSATGIWRQAMCDRCHKVHITHAAEIGHKEIRTAGVEPSEAVGHSGDFVPKAIQLKLASLLAAHGLDMEHPVKAFMERGTVRFEQ